MKQTIILLMVLGITAIPSMARSKKLEALDIHSVYVYSKLVHPNDASGQQTVAWMKYAFTEMMGWKVINHMQGADAVAILVPHGEGYQQATSTSCASNDQGLECTSDNGSSLTIDCINGSCWSRTYTGNYLSIVIATPFGNPTSRSVKVVWDSDKAATKGWFGKYQEALNSIPHHSKESLTTLCRSEGLGGLRKCNSEVGHSRKLFDKAMRQSGTVVTLP